MINRTLYLIYSFITCILISSCSVYGPAYQGQQLAYMEAPICKTDSIHLQWYAGGNFGNGAIYQAQEKNANGGITTHIAWTTLFNEGAVGLYGFAGQYTLNHNNIENKLTYKGIGIRMFSTWSLPITKHLAWQCIGAAITGHHESGDYNRFRSNTRTLLWTPRNGVELPVSLVAGVSTGVKMQLKEDQALLIRYMFGGTSSTIFMLPESLFHQFTVNYQLKKISIYTLLVVRNRGRVSLNMPLQLGLSVPLHFN